MSDVSDFTPKEYGFASMPGFELSPVHLLGQSPIIWCVAKWFHLSDDLAPYLVILRI
jgi:hypothetical protein